MKYVMFENGLGQNLPVIFPDAFVHEIVAQMFNIMSAKLMNQPLRAASAGDVALGPETSVGGHSTTLKIEHNPADAARMVMGESVAFMPDSMAMIMLEKLREKQND